ncbi:tetraacyldisaccharide 4'-kinase [Luteimonas aestuarii]|uniref:Tetraacyldisaccharide 4'-kinase n=1 Tax=Luteimonas aestuarii TaxID=453837 RepID=A0A4R5TQI0_9GAMM|nr:tetraacyldisaccharide 4'-kinase [Luteimonas aestuarii]TDK19966.1 tetraacyldisaccharide 4'-kinase [Luteimonas aestuarii]
MSGHRGTPPAWWFGDRAPPLPARALASLYGGAIALRRALYRKHLLRSQRVPVPVLVVGNLIAGGSGKTPLVIALVERLRAAGWTPGVASRGHGRDDAGQGRWVEPSTDPRLGGDEPVLIALRTHANVRVDADRVAAARALVAEGCDIVVCDDGLQHYRLQRDVEIEVVDGVRRYGNGRLLPAGPLREPVERGARCDFRVLNVGSANGVEPGFGEWPMRLHATQARPLHGGRPQSLAAFTGQRVHAVAGIGDPERFFTMLRGLGIGVVPHAFPDHHRYVAGDLAFGSDLPVLMTEKDAVKCAAFATARHFSVGIDAQLPEAFWVALLDRLSACPRTQ